MADKKEKAVYPRVEETTIRRVYINREQSWEIKSFDPEADDNCDRGKVHLYAPCGEEVFISKKEYQILRAELDLFFGIGG